MASIEEMQRDLAASGVRYVFGAYTDVHGVPKSKCVPVEHLADAAAGSELYTVGALEGMGELGPHEDECVSIPDLDAITVLPWDRRYAVAPSNRVWKISPRSPNARSSQASRFIPGRNASCATGGRMSGPIPRISKFMGPGACRAFHP